MIDPLKVLSGAYGDWQQALGASERIFEILDTHPEVKEKKDALSLSPVSGETVLPPPSRHTPIRAVSIQRSAETYCAREGLALDPSEDCLPIQPFLSAHRGAGSGDCPAEFTLKPCSPHLAT